MDKLAGLLEAATKSPTIAWRLIIVVAFASHVSWDYGWIPGVDSAHASEAEVRDTKRSLDRILEINLVEEINKLLRYKCMHPGDSTFDRTLADLEAEYRTLTGEQYRRPTCEYLTTV